MTDAFVSVDVDDINLIDNNPADCHSETLNGPLQALQVFMGAANIRAMNITASGGNTTSITSVSYFKKSCHSWPLNADMVRRLSEARWQRRCRHLHLREQ